MAKRMIDTDIFKKGFVKTLPADYKLLWIYILNDCNHAGVWEVELDIASIRLGINLPDDPNKILDVFGEKIVVFDKGKKWFIPSFIDFQYGELNEKNRAHESVLKILNRYGIYSHKELSSPLQGNKDMDKDKELDKDMEMEEGGVGETKPENNFPKVDESAKAGSIPFKAVKDGWFEYHEKKNLPRPTVGTWDGQKYERIASRISQKLQSDWKSPTYEAVKNGMTAMIEATLRHPHWKKTFSLNTIEAHFDEIFNSQKKKYDTLATTPFD